MKIIIKKIKTIIKFTMINKEIKISSTRINNNNKIKMEINLM